MEAVTERKNAEIRKVQKKFEKLKVKKGVGKVMSMDSEDSEVSEIEREEDGRNRKIEKTTERKVWI